MNVTMDKKPRTVISEKRASTIGSDDLAVRSYISSLIFSKTHWRNAKIDVRSNKLKQ